MGFQKAVPPTGFPPIIYDGIRIYLSSVIFLLNIKLSAIHYLYEKPEIRIRINSQIIL